MYKVLIISTNYLFLFFIKLFTTMDTAILASKQFIFWTCLQDSTVMSMFAVRWQHYHMPCEHSSRMKVVCSMLHWPLQNGRHVRKNELFVSRFINKGWFYYQKRCTISDKHIDILFRQVSITFKARMLEKLQRVRHMNWTNFLRIFRPFHNWWTGDHPPSRTTNLRYFTL